MRGVGWSTVSGGGLGIVDEEGRWRKLQSQDTGEEELL